MAIVRWEPARELSSFQHEVNRLFGTFFDSPTGPGGAGARLRNWVPAMDLVEEGEHYVLRADLPGVKQEDLEIEVQDNLLTISGERRARHEEDKRGYRRIERSFGSFSRSLALPEGTDPDSVDASFAEGVLEVTIPKPVERTPRRVAINAAEQAAKLGPAGSAS
jgi:HSP20 family protein